MNIFNENDEMMEMEFVTVHFALRAKKHIGQLWQSGWKHLFICHSQKEAHLLIIRLKKVVVLAVPETVPPLQIDFD